MALQAKRKYNVEDEWETDQVSKRYRASPDPAFKFEDVQSPNVRGDVFMGYQYEYDPEEEAITYEYDNEDEAITYEYDNEDETDDLFSGTPDTESMPNPSGHVCAVCSIPIHDTCQVVFLLGCGHFFHEICVDVDSVERCMMCKDKLGSRYSKIQVMPFNIAKILLLQDSKMRCDIVMNIITDKQMLEAMTARKFYIMLRKSVFGGKIPKVRNVYYKQRVLHRKQFTVVGDEVDVYIQSGRCNGLCWQDQMCHIALQIYQTVDNSNIDYIMWLLTLFEDMYLYFGTMK